MGDGPAKGKKVDKEVTYCRCSHGANCHRPNHFHRKKKRPKDGFSKRMADKGKNKKKIPMYKCALATCEDPQCHFHASDTGAWSKASVSKMAASLDWDVCDQMAKSVGVELPAPTVCVSPPILHPAKIPDSQFEKGEDKHPHTSATSTGDFPVTKVAPQLTAPTSASPAMGEGALSSCLATEECTKQEEDDGGDGGEEVEEEEEDGGEEEEEDDGEELHPLDQMHIDEESWIWEDEGEAEEDEDEETQQINYDTVEKRIFANFTKGVQTTPSDWLGSQNLGYHFCKLFASKDDVKLNYALSADLQPGVLENTLGIEKSITNQVRTPWLFRALGGSEYVTEVVRDSTASHFMEAYPHSYVGRVYHEIVEYVLADSNFRKYNTTDRDLKINVNLEAAINHTMNTHPHATALAAANESAWVHTFNHIMNRAYRAGLLRKATAIGAKPKNENTGHLPTCARTAQCSGCAQ